MTPMPDRDRSAELESLLRLWDGLPERDYRGHYRLAVLRAQVEVTPLDPMGRHRHCPFCRAPLDHHHEGRPRRTCPARACVLRWRALKRDRAAEYAAKRAGRRERSASESLVGANTSTSRSGSA